ncbi:S8 family serine peptidase [Microbacterium hominis]|uniref:S8 family serine peptidase n=1 Tax=Microbacterium hominis TaxID=162426 RepID=A0A7D4UGV7_9MICO|nr:S8 family serine peptidase [Microbacterium hominis]QKJ20189.1 S8 family serine peptidase [Microbacterium hominis]
MSLRALAVAGVLALSIPTTAAAAAAAPDDDPSSRFTAAESSGQISSTFLPRSADAAAKLSVVVQLSGDPVAVVEAQKGRDLSKTEKKAIRDSLKAAQKPVVDAVKAAGGSVQAEMQSAYNGVQATVQASTVADLTALPGVVAVREARTSTIDNAVSVPFLGVPQVWQNTGYTGENIKVAIIDTGIDYTHANFGGPGTVEAYDAAHAAETEAADPALFGPNAPRVKGGWDFVGDAYDANDDNAVPMPDSNPLDCQGHGSHVAGTTGGTGVTAEGATYTGAYDESTASQDWLIGPGVAPEVDLYALRVFGCDGSTNITVAAIDWAVENDMDVINMSLGSSYGTAEDPEAVAASNAVAAGVVVVASAGNSGPSPYINGSPGTGEGVISVAATDSTASFPGAEVTLNGVTVPAINANGADLEGLGEFTVKRLVDIDGTPENEALGCSVAAYTANGVTAGANQLAVSTRGTCARVAKAIFAQQAGAAASLMVNSSPDYPPFEGAITENPDNGDPYTVTIPFLGVRSTDGAAFTGVDGTAATIAPADLENPNFRGFASFSSNGPRSGDSGIGVDIAAPGVSIVSTGVGTGNGPSTNSGTSMAAPHVAGVAALAVQAHEGWSAADVSAAIVSSADPDGVAGYQLTRAGAGLVDTAQAVATQVIASGDKVRTEMGTFREANLSFGFQESTSGFSGEKEITLTNHGTSPVTYQVSAAPSPQSEQATVSFDRSSVTVPAGGKATVKATLTASSASVGSSLASQFALYEFSGNVVFSSETSSLRVPYLMVPRADTNVEAKTGELFGKKEKVVDAAKSVTLTNKKGASAAIADFYQWGLTDKKDVAKQITDTGFDLANAGVQSFPFSGTQLLVFAVNTHQRWSNAAAVEFDVLIDTNRDGKPDFAVFAVDSGLVRAGSVDGRSEVFIANLNTGGLSAQGFLAQAPTDSSTILLPVTTSALGLTAANGTFDYTVASFSLTDSAGFDEFDGMATYNPFAPAIENGQFVEVAKNGTLTVPVAVDGDAVAAQKPLGVMAAVVDNQSGTSEAVLVKMTK